MKRITEIQPSRPAERRVVLPDTLQLDDARPYAICIPRDGLGGPRAWWEVNGAFSTLARAEKNADAYLTIYGCYAVVDLREVTVVDFGGNVLRAEPKHRVADRRYGCKRRASELKR